MMMRIIVSGKAFLLAKSKGVTPANCEPAFTTPEIGDMPRPILEAI